MLPLQFCRPSKDTRNQNGCMYLFLFNFFSSCLLSYTPEAPVQPGYSTDLPHKRFFPELLILNTILAAISASSKNAERYS